MILVKNILIWNALRTIFSVEISQDEELKLKNGSNASSYVYDMLNTPFSKEEKLELECIGINSRTIKHVVMIRF